MKDIKFDNFGNLVIENGDLVVIEDAEQVAQSIRQRLSYFYGEWAFNRTGGIPWFELIFRKDVPISISIGVIKDCILTTTGVAKLLSFDIVELNVGERTASIETTILYDSEEQLPFNFSTGGLVNG